MMNEQAESIDQPIPGFPKPGYEAAEAQRTEPLPRPQPDMRREKRGPVDSEFRPLADPPFVPPVPSDTHPVGYSPAQELGLDKASEDRREASLEAQHENETAVVNSDRPERRLTDAQIRLAHDMEMVAEALAAGFVLPSIAQMDAEKDGRRYYVDYYEGQHIVADARDEENDRLFPTREAAEQECDKLNGKPSRPNEADEMMAKARSKPGVSANPYTNRTAGFRPGHENTPIVHDDVIEEHVAHEDRAEEVAAESHERPLAVDMAKRPEPVEP